VCGAFDLPAGLAGHAGFAGRADGCFSFFQSSGGMNYVVHTRGYSELAILMLLTLLDLLVVVLNFLQPSCDMSYDVHNKGYSGPAILVFLTFLLLLVVDF
jgi:hypothetical protein